MEGQERTEKPTGKRKAELRKKGNIPKSNDFSSSVSLLVFFAILFLFSERIYSGLLEVFRHFFSMIGKKEFNEVLIFSDFLKSFLFLTAPITVSFFVFAVASHGVPSGFVFTKPSLKFENLNIISNFKKLFSLNSLIESFKNILKLAIIIFFLYSFVKSEIPAIFYSFSQALSSSLFLNFSIFKDIMIKIALISFFISAIDLVYRIYEYDKKSRMTKQEVKDEFKQMEGNPQIKGKIKAMMRMFSRRNKLSEVKKSAVVITNPTHYAVALKYNKENNAPVVVAKGVDKRAFKIIEEAKKYGVPVRRNPPLARAMFKMCEVGEEINPVFYRAVAEILAVLYREKQRKAI